MFPFAKALFPALAAVRAAVANGRHTRHPPHALVRLLVIPGVSCTRDAYAGKIPPAQHRDPYQHTPDAIRIIHFAPLVCCTRTRKSNRALN
jgi:hypothetical protein